MLSVYQHWDPLKVCAVGRSYPPEFYSFIENPKVRSVMERIAIETEEDYQKLIRLLESFGVTVIRNDISDNIEDHFWAGHYSPPPMTPRDHTAMIGTVFFMPGGNYGINNSPFDILSDFSEELYLIESKKNITIETKEKILKSILKKLNTWDSETKEIILNRLKSTIRSINNNPLTTFPNNKKFNTFSSIEKYVKNSGNKIIYDEYINTACTTRVGKDLYFGTVGSWDIEEEYLKEHVDNIKKIISDEYRIHLVNSNTHIDACFNPVKPGLIVSLCGVENYNESFPDWEVVYLPNEGGIKIKEFFELRKKNHGKWWVPGEELNDDFTDYVESWLEHWVLCVEETVFDVNMLVIDENNVVCNNYNKDVFDAFQRHNITPHVINFRHRYFWDGGLHCITSDLHRQGTMKDYFPERTKSDCISKNSLA
jgi:N-dimethylarginine dimethylaminohydrolase